MKTKEQRLAEIAAKFKQDMEKLGLGVTMSAAGESFVVIEPPADPPAKEEA